MYCYIVYELANVTYDYGYRELQLPLQKTLDWLDKNQLADPDEFRSKHKELEDTMTQIMHRSAEGFHARRRRSALQDKADEKWQTVWLRGRVDEATSWDTWKVAWASR